MKRVTWDILLLASLFLTTANGQTTGSITVRLSAPGNEPVPAAAIHLDNRTSGFHRELILRDDGTYRLSDIPLAAYVLATEATGFEPLTREVDVRSNVPIFVDLALKIATVRDSVTVGARATADLVDPQATGTHLALSEEAMAKVPTPAGNRGLEAYLLTFPGFAMNANGAIHPRGAHNQMTYVVDGLPITDQLTGAFATALDPGMVSSLELYTGDVPAEFGAKVSGVAVVSARSGTGAGQRQFAEVETGAGSFDLTQGALRAGGERGRLGWFTSISGVKTHRFLDQVSLDNLHNGGNAERGFMRVDFQLNDSDTLRFNAMAGRSGFELANLRSQQASGMDQRQQLRDASLWMHWTRVLNASSTWESTVGWRPTIAQLFPSAGDTPVSAEQSRHLSTLLSTNRYNRVSGIHQIRAGIDFQRFHVSESFRMAIRDPLFNDPLLPGFNAELGLYDLSRGGAWFRFADRGVGTLASAFVQDMLHWRRLVLSLGLRFDDYRFLARGHQLQPRIGFAFHLKETGTVLRGSYNRNYQTPPNENLLLSASPAAARIAGAILEPLRPQRENVIEAGVQQALFKRASVNASFFHKDSQDQQDNNNFFDTGIIFPLTLARIRVNGAEGRLVLPPVRGLTATLSATHSHAVSTPPFTGGLFVGQQSVDLLNAGPFVIDHDQKLSMNVSAHYGFRRNWWTSTSVRYDSGLVANPDASVANSANTDYRDLLKLVDFTSTPIRVRPRTVSNLAVGYQHRRGERRVWDVDATLENVTNITALYNFRSVFVGTRVVSPRAAAIRMRIYF